MIRCFTGRRTQYDSPPASRNTREEGSSQPTKSSSADSIELVRYTAEHTVPLFKGFQRQSAEIKKFIPALNEVNDLASFHAALTVDFSGNNIETSTILAKKKPVGVISATYLLNNRSKGIKLDSTWIDAKYRNKGIMTAAKRAYIDRAMRDQVAFVQSVVSRQNTANQHVMKKLNIPIVDSSEKNFIYRVTPETWTSPS